AGQAPPPLADRAATGAYARRWDSMKGVYERRLSELPKPFQERVTLVAFMMEHESLLHLGQWRKGWALQGFKVLSHDPNTLLSDVRGHEAYFGQKMHDKLVGFDGSSPYTADEITEAVRFLVGIAPEMARAGATSHP